MDRKIRIHFLPKDASGTRLLSFSRSAGIAFLLTLVPLCLLGFWLAISGAARESNPRRLERIKLERENRALKDKVSGLQHESSALSQGMDSVESARIRAALISGQEAGSNAPKTENETFRNFGFSRDTRKPKDFSRALNQARSASSFFDSSFFVLSQNLGLAGRFPTSYPVDAAAMMIRPFGIGQDPFTGRSVVHTGVDFSLRPGAPVYAAGRGRVSVSGKDPLWGDYVRIRHTNQAETFYAHLQRAKVRTGQEIERGQIIGWMGQSGIATGPHLHFEMLLMDERVDPLRYLLLPEAGSGIVSAR